MRQVACPDTVLRVVERAGRSLSAAEVARALGTSSARASRVLRGLWEEGQLIGWLEYRKVGKGIAALTQYTTAESICQRSRLPSWLAPRALPPYTGRTVYKQPMTVIEGEE